MTDKKALERIGMIFALVTFAVALNTVLVVRESASHGETTQPPFVAARLVR